MSEPEPDIAALQERIRLLEKDAVLAREALMKVLSVPIDFAVLETILDTDLKEARIEMIEGTISAVGLFATSPVGGDPSVEG